MYRIGLDIGITSVGYAVIETDISGEPLRIMSMSSRIFDAAEEPKTGASLAEPRREARGLRRRVRRRKHRKDRIKALLVRQHIVTKDELITLFKLEKGIDKQKDIYETRYNALYKKLDNKDFAKLLIHLAQRRGFKSNRKADSNDKEAGKLLKAIESNKELLNEKNYKTIGEMLWIDDRFKTNKRNKSEDYSNTYSREMMIDEVHAIFAMQREFGNIYASEDIENHYLDIFTSQRSFAEGPGGESPYGGDQIEKMLGKCTFYPDETRAVKASYTFEYSTLLQKVNNIRIKRAGSVKRELSPGEKQKVIALAHKTSALKYSTIRKELALSDTEYFGDLYYGSKEISEVEKDNKSGKFEFLKAYHIIRKALDKLDKGHINTLSDDKKDCIAYAFTVFKTDDKIIAKLTKGGLTSMEIDALMDMKHFAKAGHLSIKALRKIIPFLEKGLKYNEACAEAGIDFKAEKTGKKLDLLPPLPLDLYEVTSPVSKRAISQTIKVVNAIIRKYGKPAFINIELAREMSRNFKDRKELEKHMNNNRAVNDKHRERLANEFNVQTPTALDVLRLKLHTEQGGRCIYTGEVLSIERLFETGYCDIDHIIPYSICFDDSYKNKGLCTAKANREKRNRIPLEYLTGDDADKFKTLVMNTIRDKVKRDKLLKTELTPEDTEGMKERALQDTQHITKFIYNYIRNNLSFDETIASEKTKRVTAVNGAVTAYMRKRWGLNKVRADGDLHHSLDAAVVACISDGTIQKVSRFSKAQENKYTHSVIEGDKEYIINNNAGDIKDVRDLKEHFPAPWQGFRSELEARLSDNPAQLLASLSLPAYQDIDIENIQKPFVSRMPRKKIKGSGHEATIRRHRIIEGKNSAVTKTDLYELKIEKGEIKNYYDKACSKELYESLKERLIEFTNEAKASLGMSNKEKFTDADNKKIKKYLQEKFANEPFYHPFYKDKFGNPNLVKKVKISKKATLTVALNKDNRGGKAVADNGDMVRIDMFHIGGEGYYFVPIYASDMLKLELPNKAVVKGKEYSQWKEMSDDNFIFSLYPNDLIKVTHKNPMEFSLVNKKSTLEPKKIYNDVFLYYKSSDISDATIKVINNDNTYFKPSLGIKTLVSIEKYVVDVLGQVSRVARETRQYPNQNQKNK